MSNVHSFEEPKTFSTSPTPAKSSMNSPPLSTQSIGASAAHPVSQSLRNLEEEPTAFVTPSSSIPATNDYVDRLMFQPFVDFFEGPIALRSPSNTESTVVSSNSVIPLSSASSTGDHKIESIVDLSQSMTVVTIAILIWPALCVKQRVMSKTPDENEVEVQPDILKVLEETKGVLSPEADEPGHVTDKRVQNAEQKFTELM
ncbi:hypothetical protein C8R42DRAFT_645835 [Lentinula raphanica]|nr:hypothetical protein C8R42DRAFT_645835 [Lentinula raphanica]